MRTSLTPAGNCVRNWAMRACTARATATSLAPACAWTSITSAWRQPATAAARCGGGGAMASVPSAPSAIGMRAPSAPTAPSGKGNCRNAASVAGRGAVATTNCWL